MSAAPDGEQLDFLLASIADLDREFEAGDLNDDEYRTLRAKYVAAAASEIRGPEESTAPQQSPISPTPGRKLVPSRRVLMWVGFTALAVIIGATFARFSGARAPGETTTGTGSLSSRLDACAQLGPANPEGGSCYEQVLEDFPDQPEALTYSAWAKIRADDVDAGVAQLNRAIELDPKLPDPHVFLAVAASRAEDWATAEAELANVYKLDPPPALLSVLQQQQLELKIAEGQLSAETATCWSQMRAVIESEVGANNGSKIVDVITCLGDRATALVPKAQTGDAAALKELTLVRSLLGFVMADSDERLAETGLSELGKALQLSPGDPSALMLRGFVYGSLQRWDLAAADADAAVNAPARPSGLVTWFLGQPEALVQAVADASKEAAASGPSGASSPVSEAGASGSSGAAG